MASNATPAPPLPLGWQATWSTQYNQWFYVDEKSGNSQWEHPSPHSYGPPPPTSPQHLYNNQTQPQYPQRNSPSPPTTNHADVPTDRGIMSKLNSLDPRAQSLFAAGSLAASAFLEHEYAEHHHQAEQHHQPEQHNLVGSMANLIGATGAGALGAKFFGRKGQTTQPQPAPHPPVTPYQPAPQPPYQPAPQPPYHTSPPPGHGYPYPASPPAYAIPSASPPILTGSNTHPPSLVPLPFPNPIQPHSSAGPPLRIHAATFADADVTERVRRLITPTQELIIAKLADEFGDPWPEAKRKAFSVLYQFGERPLEVWCGSTDNPGVEIRNEALSNTRMALVNKDPGRIICLIWGQSSVLSKERVEKLEKDGELDCKELGDGGFWPWEIRNLICFYRMEDGRVGIGHGREGGTMRLPWNPLARWS